MRYTTYNSNGKFINRAPPAINAGGRNVTNQARLRHITLHNVIPAEAHAECRKMLWQPIKNLVHKRCKAT